MADTNIVKKCVEGAGNPVKDGNALSTVDVAGNSQILSRRPVAEIELDVLNDRFSSRIAVNPSGYYTA